MSDDDEYRRRADALLKLAAGADNMRSELVSQAAHWHQLAMDAHAHWRDDEDDAAAAAQEQA